MKAELITTDHPSWSATVAKAPHDFYHRPSYVALGATTDGGDARAVLVSEGERALLLPVLLRKTPDGAALDATSPYGYPGPVRAGFSPGDSFETEALSAALGALRSHGAISLFVRLHPIFDEALEAAPEGTLQRHGETVVIDLAQEPSQWWSETASGHRNEINRAVRAGNTVVIDAWEHADAFAAMYRDTMARVDAQAYYFFDDAYFASLRESLGESLHLLVTLVDGAPAAAALFVESTGVVQYHLSGSNAAYSKVQPTKMLLHAARQWAKERGHRWLHLGGGLGGAEDSLFRFKAGFSKQRRRFKTWRVMLDERAYVERSSEQDAGDLSGFFPAYRRPVKKTEGA